MATGFRTLWEDIISEPNNRDSHFKLESFNMTQERNSFKTVSVMVKNELVSIIDSGGIYDRNEFLAEQLRATSWQYEQENILPRERRGRFKVLNKGIHQDGHTLVYLIESMISGRQFLIKANCVSS